MQMHDEELRIAKHPILGDSPTPRVVRIIVDGRELEAHEGEPIAAALAAHGIRKSRTTRRTNGPRWLFCGIGRCTDCIMTVNGVPNVRTCVTSVEDGMRVETQMGLGKWEERGNG